MNTKCRAVAVAVACYALPLTLAAQSNTRAHPSPSPATSRAALPWPKTISTLEQPASVITPRNIAFDTVDTKSTSWFNYDQSSTSSRRDSARAVTQAYMNANTDRRTQCPMPVSRTGTDMSMPTSQITPRRNPAFPDSAPPPMLNSSDAAKWNIQIMRDQMPCKNPLDNR